MTTRDATSPDEEQTHIRKVIARAKLRRGAAPLPPGLGGGRDPYPCILLNLLLSFQAAYTAPIIMMSQNRLADIDRDRALADYQVNLRAEAEMALLHEKIDLLREQEVIELTRLPRDTLTRLEKLEDRHT